MDVFHCDLDNTLIYSYKHDIGQDKIPVEKYQGRDISYMTPKSLELLKKIKKLINMIPTTTRSLAQYQRIDLGVGEFPFALVANGGLLLVDGQVDEPWRQESLELVAPFRKNFQEAQERLEQDDQVYFEVRWVDDLFLFTKSHRPEETAKTLEKTLDSRLQVQ